MLEHFLTMVLQTRELLSAEHSGVIAQALANPINHVTSTGTMTLLLPVPEGVVMASGTVLGAVRVAPTFPVVMGPGILTNGTLTPFSHE